MKFEELIGEGSELTPVQMGVRAIIVFIIAVAFLRLGRRALGIGSAFDHVIGILLGAILSRAVVGVSPFWSTIVAACVIVLLHRLFAWITMHSRIFGRIIKGESKLIYRNGVLNRENMSQCLITENDLMEGVRESGNVETLEEIEAAFIERDGRISVIKKQSSYTR